MCWLLLNSPVKETTTSDVVIGICSVPLYRETIVLTGIDSTVTYLLTLTYT
jgi:hypothetical protein